MEVARSRVQSLIELGSNESNVPTKLEDIAGEWELVFTTVKHGIFRSSPFFLAVQEAFEYAEKKEVCILCFMCCIYFAPVMIDSHYLKMSCVLFGEKILQTTITRTYL